ncbi:hypothetical protein WH7805_12078 [Synechococcus sp. WH 7805]|nr:hypothetical protein WH7805_12078 [Synechococcus sp. WH 7805]
MTISPESVPTPRRLPEWNGSVDPEHTSLFIHEVATLSLLDPHHGIEASAALLVAINTKA